MASEDWKPTLAACLCSPGGCILTNNPVLKKRNVHRHQDPCKAVFCQPREAHSAGEEEGGDNCGLQPSQGPKVSTRVLEVTAGLHAYLYLQITIKWCMVPTVQARAGRPP